MLAEMAVARSAVINSLQKIKLFGQSDVRGQLPSFSTIKRHYNNIPLTYTPEKDPAPLFFSLPVQGLLKYLTRPDYAKIFRKRTNRGDKGLSTPEYKFLTNEQLEEERKQIAIKVEYLLQMPPVIKIRSDASKCIYNDPALRGYETAKFVFTDISYGLRDSERLIVIREPDGSLNFADHDTRKRLNQVYNPKFGRNLKEPAMFTDLPLFEKLMKKTEYEFVLDRACVQYEPDDPEFQRILGRVFQHIDENSNYNFLRSTRHFGPMSFYLAWHNIIDGLMLDLLQNGIIREAVSLISLQRLLHPELVADDDSQALSQQILESQKNLDETQYEITNLDIDLDEKCMECVSKYIQTNSSKKGQHELALQAFQELYREKVKVDKGVKVAHGSA